MDKKEATDGFQRQGHSTRKLKERCVFGVDTQGLEVHWRGVVPGIVRDSAAARPRRAASKSLQKRIASM